MFKEAKLELKVGFFIGIAIFLMFCLIFLVSDFYFKERYNINVVFDYVNGITEKSPVRLAGVNIGEIKDINLYYDQKKGKNCVKLKISINKEIKIAKDAIIRINTLGLLGEQYLEISPGKEDLFLQPEDTVIGRNPVHLAKQIEDIQDFISYGMQLIKDIKEGKGTVGQLLTDQNLYSELNVFFNNLNQGKGTLGQLLSNDSLYNNLEGILGKMNNGQGTIGKLLTKDKIYNDMTSFAADIKDNPWKLLRKTSNKKD